MDSDSERL